MAGALFIVLRLEWEHFFPLTADSNKGLIYLRDYLLLGPASLCWLIGMWNLKKTPATITDSNSISVLLSLLCFGICFLIATLGFKEVAQIIDEVVYLFQAKIFVSGSLWAPAPPLPEFFQIPYTAIHEDKWFGIFFPGQSILLAIGWLFNAPYIINPILSGCLVFITMITARKLFDPTVSLLAGMICAFSPFVLLQGSSYFGHVIAAIFFMLSIYFLLTLESNKSRWMPPTLGFCLGALALCRPMSMVVVVIFGVGWLSYLWKAQRLDLSRMGKMMLGFLPVFFAFGIIQLIDNKILTGEFLMTPHQYAIKISEFSGQHFLSNTFLNILALSVDFLGMPLISLIPFGWYVLSGNKYSYVLLSLVLLNFLIYGLYSYHGISYGPRFHFELVPFLCMGTAYALVNAQKVPPLSFLLGCFLITLCGVLPARLSVYSERADFYHIEPLISASSIERPALIFIEQHLQPDEIARVTPYIAGFQLNPIDLKGEIIYAIDKGEHNTALISQYKGYHPYLLDLHQRTVVPLKPEFVSEQMPLRQ